MCKMYSRIEELCKNHGTDITKMCRELGIPRSSLSELKSGRAKSISADKVAKISEYFGVTAIYITDGVTSTKNDANNITDNDIKFALFGGDGEITDEMLDEVKSFAQFIKNKYKKE